jgi:guanine deaminase
MESKAPSLVVQGTLMHTPVLGEVEVIENAAVVITATGEIHSVKRPADADYGQIISAASEQGTLEKLTSKQYLLPGMVDTHVHAPQWPQMGNVLDVPLNVWLDKYTFPLEAKYADLDFAGQVYETLVDTLVANGTTTAMYYATIHLQASQLLAEICLQKGQRALIGKITMDNPEQCPDYYRDASTAQGLDDTRGFIDYVRAMPGNNQRLVLPVVTPRFIPSCTDEMLVGLGKITEETDCHVQTHCSEGDWEHAFVIDRYGKSDTMSLHGFGLLTSKCVLAHCNFIDDNDMNLIKQSMTGIAHCPLANLYFSNAVFPVRKALDRGLQVSLGTDIAGGPVPSLWQNCATAITASRAVEDGVDASLPADQRGSPGARIDFREAFWMATVGGGLALDLKVGQITEGYAFDAMVVDTGIPDTNLIIWEGLDTHEAILQKIIYNIDRRNITKVWIQGILAKN